MQFRRATVKDAETITDIYNKIHSLEEADQVTIGWDRKIYPTHDTALAAINAGDMFVEVADGKIVASARINKIQVPEYADATWEFPANNDEVMVLHTLTVDPSLGKSGYGKAFVDFYEKYALENGCPYLRMDTNEKNARARAMYRKLGYKEVSIVPCVFNGIDGVQLVCLEKKIV